MGNEQKFFVLVPPADLASVVVLRSSSSSSGDVNEKERVCVCDRENEEQSIYPCL